MHEPRMRMTRRAAERAIAWLLVWAMLVPLSALGEAAEGDPLPVVSITARSLTDWEGKKDVRRAVLTYKDEASGFWFAMPIAIHIQGKSSRKYEKKNFTIKLDKRVDMRKGWGAHKKYCLKADFIDPTHAGNIVSARLAAQMQRKYGLFDGAPNAGVVDGYPIWLVMNGQPMGLYTWNIPKDEWMLGMNQYNADHIALFAERWQKDVFFRADEVDYKKGWTFAVGESSQENKDKFERLYRFVRDATDEEFRAEAHRYLDVDACINYYCFICISDARDNTAKNMLLATYDGRRWAPTLYDLDSLWGIDWHGTELWDGDTRKSVKLVIRCNGLLARIRDCFPDEVRARYAELRQYPLSRENIRAEFERFRARIPEAYYAMDKALWYPDDTHIRTYERIYSLLDEYLPTVDAAFGYEPRAEATAADGH